MDYYMHGMSCGGGWAFMSFLWILSLVIIGIAISWFNRRNLSPPQQRTAIDILKERYARGEISKNEFEDMKKDIS